MGTHALTALTLPDAHRSLNHRSHHCSLYHALATLLVSRPYLRITCWCSFEAFLVRFRSLWIPHHHSSYQVRPRIELEGAFRPPLSLAWWPHFLFSSGWYQWSHFRRHQRSGSCPRTLSVLCASPPTDWAQSQGRSIWPSNSQICRPAIAANIGHFWSRSQAIGLQLVCSFSWWMGFQLASGSAALLLFLFHCRNCKITGGILDFCLNLSLVFCCLFQDDSWETWSFWFISNFI